MLRAFVAVELDARTREAAAAVLRALRGRPAADEVRWLRPEALHVTLRFLGDIAPDRVAPIAEAVGAEVSACAPFELGLGAPRAFPSARKPRVVALSLSPAEPLGELAAAVERGVLAAGLAPESRPFRSHLTLDRARRGALSRSAVRSLLEPSPLPEAAPCAVREAVLFQSELLPSGAVHTPLRRMALGGDDHPSPSKQSEDGNGE